MGAVKEFEAALMDLADLQREVAQLRIAVEQLEDALRYHEWTAKDSLMMEAINKGRMEVSEAKDAVTTVRPASA